MHIRRTLLRRARTTRSIDSVTRRLYRIPMVLRIRFDGLAGYGAIASTMVVKVDGSPVFAGSFARGCLVQVDVAPGPHTIETAIEIGASFARSRRYKIETSNAPAEAKLTYSRLWGNFMRTLELREITGDLREALPEARVLRS